MGHIMTPNEAAIYTMALITMSLGSEVLNPAKFDMKVRKVLWGHINVPLPVGVVPSVPYWAVVLMAPLLRILHPVKQLDKCQRSWHQTAARGEASHRNVCTYWWSWTTHTPRLQWTLSSIGIIKYRRSHLWTVLLQSAVCSQDQIHIVGCICNWHCQDGTTNNTTNKWWVMMQIRRNLQTTADYSKTRHWAKSRAVIPLSIVSLKC